MTGFQKKLVPTTWIGRFFPGPFVSFLETSLKDPPSKTPCRELYVVEITYKRAKVIIAYSEFPYTWRDVDNILHS